MALKAATPRPIATLKVSQYLIPSFEAYPNCSIQSIPLRIYHECYPSTSTASQIECHVSSVGVVQPQWRYPMYREHHFHSTTHEVLIAYKGRAKLCFGGAGNPHRVEVNVATGDVMIVPAGVAHGMLEDQGDFGMVGCYPVGAKAWDHCTGSEGKEKILQEIRGLKWFNRCPIYGDDWPASTEG